METLEKYLTEEHPFDLRDITEIEQLVILATKTYKFNFDEKFAWPYEVIASPELPPVIDKCSVSTTAMILYALLRLGNYFTDSNYKQSKRIPIYTIFPINIDDNSLKKEINQKIIDASNILLNEIIDNVDYSTKTHSTTFGEDDVFTFAWLADVSMADWVRVEGTGTMQEKWDMVRSCVLQKSCEKLDKCKESNNPNILFAPLSKPQKHSFPVLRLVQTIRQIKGRSFGPIPELYEYFEKSLHEQLSFSSIPDSRFDPAELMFCLEGMLLCQKNTVDRTLFARVLEVMTSVQHENANWRPVKPYLATPQGLVLFPVSIEVANSLLRACEIFDGRELHDTFGSKSIPLLRRYWQWLRARAVRLRPHDQITDELVGWHSEHVNETKTIHLWETSQVIEFFLRYRNALQAHIARTTLVLSRFSNKPYNKPAKWVEIEGKFESVTSLGEDLKIYNDIGKSFIDPHLSGKGEKNYSMLLYGPPGTGKTSIAENIAQALGRNLIQITVSDFLEGGSAQVEARAKNIFAVLMAQPSGVVLFDEIDHFLLDRDSKRYIAQDTVFQFMTPGMLTKLNDLRRKEGVIFIVATNYEDRIDSAIKRPGRIDRKYLVLPPDLAKRIDKLKRFTEDGSIFNNSISSKEWTDLGAESLFLGHNDIKSAVTLFNQGGGKDVDILKSHLRNMARTTSLESYASRFDNSLDVKETPMGEFLCLVALRLETKKPLNDRELVVVKKAANIINKGQGQNPPNINQDVLRKFTQELDDANLHKVAKVINI